MTTSSETRAIAIALQQNGSTCKKLVGASIALGSTICRILRNFKGRSSFRPKKAPECPRKSTKCQDRFLKRIQRFVTSAELAHEWKQPGVSAPARAVKRRILEAALSSGRAAKKSLLSNKNMKDRLLFFNICLDWTAGDWEKVIFSGKVSFRLFGPSRSFLVQRREIERYHESLSAVPRVTPTAKH